MGFKGGCKNITIQKFHPLGGRGPSIFIGLHGDAEGQEVMENLNYINIDISTIKRKADRLSRLYGHQRRRQQPGPQRAFREYPHRRFPSGQLVNLRIFFNKNIVRLRAEGLRTCSSRTSPTTERTPNCPSLPATTKNGSEEHPLRESQDQRRSYLRRQPGKPKWYKMGDMARFSSANMWKG